MDRDTEARDNGSAVEWAVAILLLVAWFNLDEVIAWLHTVSALLS